MVEEVLLGIIREELEHNLPEFFSVFPFLCGQAWI